MQLNDLTQRRVLLVTGKGGVGKTTFTAAFARGAASAGLRTLAVEVQSDEERDAPLAEALGVVRSDPGGDGEPIRVAQNLGYATLTPSLGHKAFLHATLPMRMLADAALKSVAVRRFLAAAPTFAELGVLYRLLDLEASRSFDRIVVDLPATGHALALVQLPAAVLRVVTGGAISQAVRRGLDLLRDGQRTSAIVVTLPEPLPVSEAIELAEGLTNSGVTVGGYVMNRVPEDPFAGAELDAALAVCRSRPLLGARSAARIERARAARARLSSAQIVFEAYERDDDTIEALERDLATALSSASSSGAKA